MSYQDLISDQGLRLDGRRVNELRRIQCKLGVFTQPDGSAYLEQGNTKVLAAVYGPHQGKKGNHEEVIVNCEYSMATFATGERKSRDKNTQHMTMNIQQALSAAIKTELYPLSQIDIFIEVLQLDGSTYCAAINAATLALVDAGICLKEYVCACTASLANEIPLMDVSHIEEVSGGPTLTVASLPYSGKIAFVEMSQRFHLDQLPKVLDRALAGCKEIQSILDQAVRDHLKEVGSAGEWGTVGNK